jgi:hypothetical protein
VARFHSLNVPFLIGGESGAGGLLAGGLATGVCQAGGKMGKARLGGAFASAAAAAASGVGQVEDKTVMSAAIPPAPTQNNIPMIRISFDILTETDFKEKTKCRWQVRFYPPLEAIR